MLKLWVGVSVWKRVMCVRVRVCGVCAPGRARVWKCVVVCVELVLLQRVWKISCFDFRWMALTCAGHLLCNPHPGPVFQHKVEAGCLG